MREPLIERVTRGLLLLSKYGDCSVCAEHDEIFAGPKYEHHVEQKDRDELERLGWRFAEGGWSIFT